MAQLNRDIVEVMSAGTVNDLERLLNVHITKEMEIDMEILNYSLLQAVRYGRIDMVELLINKGADVNSNDPLKRSILMTAGLLTADEEKIFELLLQNGADINNQNSNGNSDFMLLMGSGEVPYELLIKLIDAVENIEETYCLTGGGYLHLASCRQQDENRVKMLDKLLARGLSVNSRDDNEDTPLHLMATVACSKSLKCLLDHGANIQATNRLGETALHYLACSNELPGFFESLKLVIDKGIDVNAVDFEGRTAIHHALSSKETKCDIIRQFIETGINTNIKDSYGKNEMYHAVEAVDIANYTELHLAQRMDIMDLLAETGVDVNAKDNFGIAPLHIASVQNDIVILSTLLELGANIPAKSQTGATALHWACKTDNMANILIAHCLVKGISINDVDSYGSTPLHWAVWYSNYNVCLMLLQAGAETNIPDKAGDTPSVLAQKLHWDNFDELLITYKSLKVKRLEKPCIECSGINSKSIFVACPLLRRVRKINEKLMLEVYESHISEHKSAVQKLIKVVIESPDKGLYYDIKDNDVIPDIFNKLVNDLAERVGKRDQLFECKLRLAGSSFEGTKVYLPDEYDFIWDLSEIGKAVEPVETDDCPHGFVKLRLTDETQKSHLKDYLDRNGFLNCKLLLRRLYGLINEEMQIMLKHGMRKEYKNILCTKFLDEMNPSISSFEFHYFGQQAKFIMLSIDIVPTVSFNDWRPRGFSVDKHLLLQGFEGDVSFPIVFKTLDRYHVKDYTMFYRVSYAYLEQSVLRSTPVHVKKGYIILKALCESQYIPGVIDHDCDFALKYYVSSYQLKTAFLYALEQNKLMCGSDLYVVPDSKENSRQTSISWAKRITDMLEARIQNHSLAPYFSPSISLIGPGDGMVSEKDIRLGIVSLMKLLIGLIDEVAPSVTCIYSRTQNS